MYSADGELLRTFRRRRTNLDGFFGTFDDFGAALSGLSYLPAQVLRIRQQFVDTGVAFVVVVPFGWHARSCEGFEEGEQN